MPPQERHPAPQQTTTRGQTAALEKKQLEAPGTIVQVEREKELLFKLSLETLIQNREAQALERSSGKALLEAICNFRPEADSLVRSNEKTIQSSFGELKNLYVLPSNSPQTVKNKLTAAIDQHATEATNTFYKALSTRTFLTLTERHELLTEQLTKIRDTLKSLPANSPLHKPARETVSALESYLSHLKPALQQLKKLAAPANEHSDPRTDFLKFLSQNPLQTQGEILNSANSKFAQAITNVRKANERAALIDMTLDAIAVAAIAIAAGSTYGVGSAAAPEIAALRLALGGSLLFTSKRYGQGLERVLSGELSHSQLLKETVVGYPGDLLRSTIAVTGATLAGRAAQSSALAFLPEGAKAGATFNLVSSSGALLERAGDLSLGEAAGELSISLGSGLLFGTTGQRFAQLRALARTTKDRRMLAVTECALLTLMTAELESARSPGSLPESGTLLPAFIQNAVPTALGHFLHRGIPLQSSPTVEQLRRRAFFERGKEAGLPPKVIDALVPEEGLDPVTGFHSDRDVVTGMRTERHRYEDMKSIAAWSLTGGDHPFTKDLEYRIVGQASSRTTAIDRLQSQLRISWRQVEQMGLRVRSTFYIEIDVGNLTGLNKYLENLLLKEGYGTEAAALIGKELGNTTLRAVSKIFREELSKISGHAEFYRHGGDELSAIAINADPREIRSALARVENRVQHLIREKGLEHLPSVKEERPPGMGIYFGVASFEANDYNLRRIWQSADLQVEQHKKRVSETYQKNRDAHSDQNSVTYQITGTAELRAIQSATAWFESLPQIDRTLRPFATPDEVYDAYNLRRLRTVYPEGTLEQARTLFERAPRDPVTGLFDKTQRLSTLMRAIADTRRNSQPTFWVSSKIENLAGLNAAKGHSGANTVMADIVKITMAELNAEKGTVIGIKNTGGYFNFLTVGISEQRLQEALSRAQRTVLSFAQKNGLQELKNPQGGAGVTLSVGAAPVRPNSEIRQVLVAAERAMIPTPQ